APGDDQAGPRQPRRAFGAAGAARAGAMRAFRFSRARLQFAVISAPIAHPSSGPRGEALTRAELDVLELLVQGRSNAEIAARRGTATRTAANQVAAIFKKYEVSSRVELINLLASDR